MIVSRIRGSLVRFALIGLVSLGVVGGTLTSVETASAKPRTQRCTVLTSLSQTYRNQANLWYALGYYQLASTYYEQSIKYSLAAMAEC
jgi:hypothetical protein